MTGRWRRVIFLLIGFTVSVVSLWQIFRDTPADELWQALEKPNYWWLVPNIFFVVLAMYQRAYRWRFMIAPIKMVSFSRLLAATCIGFMANNILPLRLGEYVRAYSLSRQDGDVSKSSSLATIFVERMVFDLVALLLIFGVVLFISPLHFDEQLRVGTYAAVLAALLGLIFIVILALKPSQSGEVLTRYLFFAPESVKEKVRGIVLRFSRGLDFMKDGKKLLSVSVQTIILWLFMGLSNYFVFLSFGFDLTLEASYVLLVVVSIMILIPSSPGFFGVYHLGTVLTMSLYQVADVDARAFSIVLHLAQYIPITLMGFYFLRRAHLSLKSLEKEAVGGM
ncbi:MAG TPA: lysylphosphatidylglycerol synthase transmembrane domain-containing protein [Acidobacteriota bacterium]|nr:lysylphosphatidylglycerol synthase transmembrane domain-containing protein [Acidobacteriota bacterium]